MLVLSRREREGTQILIQVPDGPEIVVGVTLLQIQGSKVRLGFQAGPEVRILRDEVLAASQERQPAPAAEPECDQDKVLGAAGFRPLRRARVGEWP
jgi:carbon storage regulator CsrA